MGLWAASRGTADPDNRAAVVAGQARGAMIWTDGHGREWQVDAGPKVITLRSGDDSLRLERAAWKRDVQLSAAGQNLIARFCGPDVEVGFLGSASPSLTKPPARPRRRRCGGVTARCGRR